MTGQKMPREGLVGLLAHFLYSHDLSLFMRSFARKNPEVSSSNSCLTQP